MMTYFLSEAMIYNFANTETQKPATTTLAVKMRDFAERQRAKKELYGMSDRDLADLRISRSEIQTVVDGPEITARRAKPFILKRLFSSAAEYLGRKQKEWAGVRALMVMDAHQLRDLGLTPDTLHVAVKGELPVAVNDNQPAAQNDNGRRHAV